jgi:hypothetical protein
MSIESGRWVGADNPRYRGGFFWGKPADPKHAGQFALLSLGVFFELGTLNFNLPLSELVLSPD